MNAWVATEIKATALTRVGLLADVCDAFYPEGIDILAIGAYDKDNLAEFLLIATGDLAEKKLTDMGMTVTSSPVVCIELPSRAGALAPVARALADAGVNVAQIHATTAPGATNALAVLKVEDAHAVAHMLSAL